MQYLHIGWMDDDDASWHRLAQGGLVVSKDLAVNPGAAGLDIAFAPAGPSFDHARALVDAALAEGAHLAVVTMAALGSIASDGRQLVDVRAKPTTVLDTLGAGDTFIAGFLAGQCLGLGLAACLDRGHAAAAQTSTHWGGFPQQPEIM